MNFSLECSIHFKNDAGSTVEVKSLEGRKGFLIELIMTDSTGVVTKNFSEHASSPVPEENIYSAILLEVSSLLKQKYKLHASSIPLVFPEIGFDDFWQPSISLTRAELTAFEDMVIDDYVAQSVRFGEPVRVYIKAGNKHFVSMKDKHDQVMAIPTALLSTLADWHVVDCVSEVVLDGYLAHDGTLTLTDILYDKGPLTEIPTLTRLAVLEEYARPNGVVTVAAFGTGKDEIAKLEQACFNCGLSLLFSKNLHISDEIKRWIMDFKEEAQLTIMAIDHTSNEVKLCANISNVPVELGRAPIPKGMELLPLDGVAIKYGKLVAGELMNVEIISKLDTTEQLPLDPVLAQKLGYAVRPVAIQTNEDEPAHNTGILSALDAAHE
ncbi:hypothetical protein [Vibrio parahaemolyticus]|uniref:hypothetical protein n=1 Tax=Vibrio parahaemolyticus TaxID=670 RepID=UPI0023EB059C|nr:hypothetical protein [Vibrio parahaemolyticus]